MTFNTIVIILGLIIIGLGFVIKEIELQEWKASLQDKRKRTITKLKKYKGKLKNAI